MLVVSMLLAHAFRQLCGPVVSTLYCGRQPRHGPIGTQDVTGVTESRWLMGNYLLMGADGPTGSGHAGLPNRTFLFGNRGTLATGVAK